MVKNIQTSTIKVPKSVLEDIKIYCKKHGKPVGEWVATAWKFIEKNDFDIYDEESTPALMIPDVQVKQEGQVEGLCMLMKELITTQKEQQLAMLPPSDYVELREYKARAEEQIKNLQEDLTRLNEELEQFRVYKEKAYAELCRVRDEQPVIGKIKVNTEL